MEQHFSHAEVKSEPTSCLSNLLKGCKDALKRDSEGEKKKKKHVWNQFLVRFEIISRCGVAHEAVKHATSLGSEQLFNDSFMHKSKLLIVDQKKISFYSNTQSNARTAASAFMLFIITRIP